MENWVRLRRACSPFEVFTKLWSGVEEDIKIRNELKFPNEQVNFKLVLPESGAVDKFDVVREGPQIWASLEFSWNDSGIIVREQGRIIHTATLTLTDEAECKLKIKASGEELTCWQFRKRVLEDLFFNFS